MTSVAVALKCLYGSLNSSCDAGVACVRVGGDLLAGRRIEACRALVSNPPIRRSSQFIALLRPPGLVVVASATSIADMLTALPEFDAVFRTVQRTVRQAGLP
jgi:hypothetical protein